MKARYYDTALTYHAAGLKVIPFFNGADGLKTFTSGYARYRDAQTEKDIYNLFNLPCDGIALLCTDGIEAIDIDTKHDPAGMVVSELTPLFERLEMPAVIQKTKSDGLHIIYRCDQPGVNQKLARRDGCIEAMIETRGQGGLLFIYPTPGYQILHGDLLDIPQAEQSKRDQLIAACRHLNAPEKIVKIEQPKSEPVTSGLKPWEAYDQSTQVLDMMEHYGWTVVTKSGDFIRLNRPGAKHSKGIDGSVNVKENYFYPFSTSGGFEVNRGYKPSAIYAIMEHGGDFKATARDLYAQGFGDRIEVQEAEKEQEQVDKLFLSMMNTKFDVTAEIEEQAPILKFYQGSEEYPLAGRGMIGVLTGHEKSGKSFVLGNICASGVDYSNPYLNYSLDLQGGNMVYFDTEQSETFYKLSQRRIHRWAGEMRNLERYSAFALRRFAPAERLKLIEQYIYSNSALTCVVIDGFVDLLTDYNNLGEVQTLIGHLLRWSDEMKVLVLGVLHLNKGDGKIRGHLGSELKNKCDFILNVSQPEDNQYIIMNPSSRYRRLPSMEFTRGQSGDPIYDRANILNRSTIHPIPAGQGPGEDAEIPF
jgi:hypothetical protein